MWNKPEGSEIRGTLQTASSKNGESEIKRPIGLFSYVDDKSSVIHAPCERGAIRQTVEGVRSVKAALRQVMRLKYGIRDEKIFSGVYKYIEQYY